MTAELFDGYQEKLCDKEYLEEHKSEIEGKIVFAGETTRGRQILIFQFDGFQIVSRNPVMLSALP